MDELPGSVGTSASFSLRLGQTMFSSASLLFMSLGVEFYSYTAFWYLFFLPLPAPLFVVVLISNGHIAWLVLLRFFLPAILQCFSLSNASFSFLYMLFIDHLI